MPKSNGSTLDPRVPTRRQLPPTDHNTGMTRTVANLDNKGLPVPYVDDADALAPAGQRASLLSRYLDRLGGVGGVEFWQIIADAARGELRGGNKTTGELSTLPTVAERVDAAKFILAYQHGKPRDTIQLDANLTLTTKWDPSRLSADEPAHWQTIQEKIEGRVVDALPPDAGHD